MGADVYSQSVLETTPIGCSLRKLQEKDKASLEVKFNIAYYLAKRERPFTDYPHLITLEKRITSKILVIVTSPIEVVQYSLTI